MVPVGCPPNSKAKDFERFDMSPSDLIALDATRTNGQVTANLGLQKSGTLLNGEVGMTFSATKEVRGTNAIRVIRSPIVQSLVPESVDRMVLDCELRNNTSNRKPMMPLPSVSLPSTLLTSKKNLVNWTATDVHPLFHSGKTP